MNSRVLPSLDRASFPLRPIRDDDRRAILELLNAIRTKKALVLEQDFVQPLGLIVDAITLKEHGIEMFCVLEHQPSVVAALVERNIHHIVYLTRSRLQSVQDAISHISMCRDVGAAFQSTILLMPRKVQMCEVLLGGAGLLGDVSVRACPLSWVALEEDVLSLEAPEALKELSVDGNSSCLHDLAYALIALQRTRGAIPHIKGKGQWASTVQKIMMRMRREAGVSSPAPGSHGGIDTLILLDRTVDIVTPMCTQFTYEGLLDEVLGLSCGQIRSEPSTTAVEGSASAAGSLGRGDSHKKVSGLNSSDSVFAETRDRFYLGSRRWLNETLRSIQQFRDAGMAGADITRLKGFVAELRDKFSRIPLHTSLVDQIGEVVKSPGFAARMRLEAALLNEEADLAGIEDLVARCEDIIPVLRLLCLYCAVHGGVPKRQYDALRRDLLNTYGHEHLLTLRALGKAGLLHKRDGGGASSFPAVKEQFKLLMREGEVIDELEPSDVHFVYAGYAPLSVRIVQQALGAGWSAAGPAMAALGGRQFEVLQTTDDQGMPIEKPDVSRSSKKDILNGGSGDASKPRRTVMVFFIGGATHAEVAALRFLSRKGLVDCDFLVGTTKMVNGSTLLESMMPLEV